MNWRVVVISSRAKVELKLGYRSKYICQTAKMIAGGGIDLDALKEMEYKNK